VDSLFRAFPIKLRASLSKSPSNTFANSPSELKLSGIYLITTLFYTSVWIA